MYSNQMTIGCVVRNEINFLQLNFWPHSQSTAGGWENFIVVYFNRFPELSRILPANVALSRMRRFRRIRKQSLKPITSLNNGENTSKEDLDAEFSDFFCKPWLFSSFSLQHLHPSLQLSWQYLIEDVWYSLTTRATIITSNFLQPIWGDLQEYFENFSRTRPIFFLRYPIFILLILGNCDA